MIRYKCKAQVFILSFRIINSSIGPSMNSSIRSISCLNLILDLTDQLIEKNREYVPFTKVKRVSKLYTCIMPMRILPAVLYISKTPGTVETNLNRMHLYQKHQGQVQIHRSNLKGQL